MRRPRIFIETLSPEAGAPALLELSVPDSHHLKNVLRLRPHAELSLIDKQGVEHHGVIQDFRNGKARVRITEPRSKLSNACPVKNLQVTLYQAPPKGSRMDAAIAPLSELGAGQFVPIVCERSIFRNSWAARLSRWQRLANASAKQCGRTKPLQICTPEDFSVVAGKASSYLQAYLLTPEEKDPRTLCENIFSQLKDLLRSDPQVIQVALLIGPEGGFTPGEQQLARNAGWQPLCLNPLILRSENAGPAAMAILQFMVSYYL